MGTPATRILAGTSDGSHLVGDDDAVRFPLGHSVDTVSVAEGVVWAILDGALIWRGEPGGEGEVVAKFESGRALCLLSTEEGVLVGADGARLFRIVGGEWFKVDGFDNAPGRSEWYTPWGGPPDVRSIASDPDGTLYANVHVGGVIRSTDGGETWHPTMDIDADVHEVATDPIRPATVYAASARGLGISHDGATTWRFERDGLHAGYCRAVAVGRDTVYVSASYGPGGQKAAVYRRPLDSLVPFERCQDGLPDWFSTNINTFCLAADGDLGVIGDADGTVYASLDAGATWEKVATGLPAISCIALIS